MPTTKSKKTTNTSKTKRKVATTTTAVKTSAKSGEVRTKTVDGKTGKVVTHVQRVKGVFPGPLSKAEVVMNKQVNGFVDFLREQSVVGLAIGLVLGTQVKQLVDSLVLNFFNPLIGLFLPGSGSLDKKVFTLHLFGKSGQFGYGAFLMTLLNFIIVAAVVYFIFKGLKLDRLAKKKEEPAKEDDKDSKDKSKKASKKK